MLIQPNQTKPKLKQGLPVYGVISTSDDPQFAELCDVAGFDYYMLDAEHGLLDPAQAIHVILACERTNITPLIRIGSKDPKLVLQYHDAGMMGIMMPGLETVGEVKMLVDAVKYSPLGKRGMGISRASGYTAYSGAQAPEYIRFANEQTMVIIQFEDEKLLDKFPAMCAVDGLDACIIGPRDLSLTMGFPDGHNHPEVRTVIDKAIAVMRKANITSRHHGRDSRRRRQALSVCSVCFKTLSEIDPAGSKPGVSHGLCLRCAEQMRREMMQL